MDREEQKEIVIEKGTIDIKDGAFIRCNKTVSVTMPEGVTVIGTAAFSGCAAVENVVLPDSITVIRGKAFYGCSTLNDVIIPEHVVVIGSYAFDDCCKLKTVTVKAVKPPTIGEKIFDTKVLDFKIKVPGDCIAAYKVAWKQYEPYIIAG